MDFHFLIEFYYVSKNELLHFDFEKFLVTTKLSKISVFDVIFN